MAALDALRHVVIMGGNDWSDANTELLVAPAGRNPNEDAKSYPGYHEAGKLFLRDWLIRVYGYRDSIDGEDHTLIWDGD